MHVTSERTRDLWESSWTAASVSAPACAMKSHKSSESALAKYGLPVVLSFLQSAMKKSLPHGVILGAVRPYRTDPEAALYERPVQERTGYTWVPSYRTEFLCWEPRLPGSDSRRGQLGGGPGSPTSSRGKSGKLQRARTVKPASGEATVSRQLAGTSSVICSGPSSLISGQQQALKIAHA